VQTPVVLLYVPWLGVADTKVSPAGKRSLTRTLVAGSGPRSDRVMVKVTVSPTLGVASLTNFVRARSACCGVSAGLAGVLPASESNWSAALMRAVFVWVKGLTTVAVSVRVACAPLARDPTIHRPVAAV